jgi:hypothetical protein
MKDGWGISQKPSSVNHFNLTGVAFGPDVPFVTKCSGMWAPMGFSTGNGAIGDTFVRNVMVFGAFLI